VTATTATSSTIGSTLGHCRLGRGAGVEARARPG
jgi:hypothetical protein